MIQAKIFQSYNVGLKDIVQVFAKNLFISIFSEKDHSDRLLLKAQSIFYEDFKSYLNSESEVDCFEKFKNKMPEIRAALDRDALAFESNDPAAKSLEEIYLAYPGFFAISIYRMAHQFCLMGVELLPRMMTEYAHTITGIDIHPSAQIGSSFFIDHGTGIVIGETSVIGNNVSIYQGVTLGGVKVEKAMAATKRHPTIEDNVTIYANATILGGNITIGKNTIVGANVWITESVPPNSIITHQSQIKVKTKNAD